MGTENLQVDYRRDLYSNCLVLSEEQQPDLSSYQVRMLMANELKGFLTCKVHQMDGKLLFYYDITSRQSLETIFEHQKISCGVLEKILSSMVDGLNTVKSFLLSMDGFLLDPRFIYMSPDREQVWFCYLPGNPEPLARQLREFSEFLLPRLDNSDRRGVVMGYAFYQLTIRESLTAEDIQALLYSYKENSQVSLEAGAASGEEDMPPEERRDWERERVPGTREELLESFFADDENEREKKERNWKKPALLGTAAAAGALILGISIWLSRPAEGLTAVCVSAAAGLLVYGLYDRQKTGKKDPGESFGGDKERADGEVEIRETEEPKEQEEEPPKEETVCLSGREGRRYGRLIPLSPGGLEALPLEKEVLLIGKSRQTADVFLDSPAVSRVHARMVWNGETYEINDLNSRNGTRVNQRSTAILIQWVSRLRCFLFAQKP